MNKKRAFTLLICMCMVCIFAGILTACGGGDNVDYSSSSAPNSNGHNGVEVIFELEGGTYQNTTRHVRMYYYIPQDGETLISPPGTYSKRELLRANYHIDGWFKTKTEHADGTVSYSDEWNFETDTVKCGDETLVLYCGWAPNVVHTYDICYYDENGDVQVYQSIQTSAGAVFNDPSDTADGRRGYTAKREPDENGKYNICYYQGKDAQGNWIPWDTSFTHPGTEEKSVAVQVFVEYLKGDFTYVSTAEEFLAAASGYTRTGNGVYLCNDIDLKGASTNGFRNNAGKFTGVFFGNGYTVKNFVLTYNVNAMVSNQQALLGDKALCISLFGNLENATIENVSFEGFSLEVDVKYTQINGVYVAPLAVLSSESSVKDVHIEGSISVKRVEISKVGVFEYETERLFWQEGVQAENSSVSIAFTDERQA